MKKEIYIFPLLLLAALLGMGLVFYATALGPGVGGDATIYITSARGLIAGHGLGWTEADGSFRLLPYSPPFYPLVLGAVGLLFKDMVAGARWLNILLFGVTIALLGWFFYYRYSRRPWLAVLLSGALAASPVILNVQVWAMTESIFLLLGFGGLLALLEYLECPRAAVLIGSALLCGLAFLTRYIGVAFVITGGLALLLLGNRQERRVRLDMGWPALRKALLFGIVAVVPTLVWLVIDFSLTGTVGSRSGQPAEAYWRRFLEICPALENIYLFWLLPESAIPRLPGIAQVALWLVPLAAALALCAMLARRLGKALPNSRPFTASSARMAVLLGLFIAVYLVVLAVVQVFTYPPITLAARMLSPVHLAVLALVFTLLSLALDVLIPASTRAARAVTLAAYLACLGLFAMYGLRSGLIARDYHSAGIGYLSLDWQRSATLEALRKLSPEVPIVSNETTAIMFLAGRPAYAIQEIYQDQPQQAFSAYGAGDDPAQRAFRSKGAALVLFKSTLRDDFAMYGERADERIRALTATLIPYYEGDDGGIYFYAKPGFTPSEDCG